MTRSKFLMFLGVLLIFWAITSFSRSYYETNDIGYSLGYGLSPLIITLIVFILAYFLRNKQ